MLDIEKILEDKIAHAAKSRDIPYSVNGFRGTWAISDHSLIPEPLVLFLMYSFKTGRLNRVPIEEINSLLNEVWEGPGSLEKIFRLTHELGKDVNFSQNDMPRIRPARVSADDTPVADRAGTASSFEAEATEG